MGNKHKAFLSKNKDVSYMTVWRQRQAELGRIRKDYYITEDEHSYLREKLRQYRLK